MSEQIMGQAYCELFRYFSSLIDFHERLNTAKIIDFKEEIENFG